jgi:DNA repair protein RecN (Recombination protein N)
VCRINGAMVSQAVLREIGDALVELTAQGASQRLLQRTWQRDAVDAAGGAATAVARAEVEAAVREWRAAEAALAVGRRAASSGAAELARARDLVADLEPLGLRPGEDAELAAERLRLRHAGGIVEASTALADAAAGDDGGAADALAVAAAAAAGLGGVDEELRALAEQADALVDALRELGLDARRLAGSVTFDEARLALIEERLDLITRAVRRHGSVEQALEDLGDARRMVAAADGGADEMARLEAVVDEARTRAAAAASRLSAERAAAARRLEQTVTAELRHLGLPHARFRVVLSRTLDASGVDLGDGLMVRCGPRGVDDVEFRFSASRDAVPRPLEDGASGGELSRVALALSAVAAEDAAPVLVLDEVDTGLGGETAARVGDALAEIGSTRQVLAITHRAEIAARASGHLVVRKHDAGAGAVATAGRAEGERRVAEIARLLSGRETDAALRRAAELLDEGRDGRSDRARSQIAARTI